MRSVPESAWGWLALYQHYRSGHLAYPGGLLKQPRVYLEAMAIISAEINSGE